MEFKYIALSIGVLLAIVLIAMELQRKNRQYLVLRLIATVVMVACLILLVFPLEYQVGSYSNSNTVNVLSRGTPADVSLDAGLKSISTDRAITRQRKAEKVQYTSDLLAYLHLHPEIKKINLYGYGLSPYELEALKKYVIHFKPAPEPQGLVKASWNSQLKNTELLLVQGFYQNSGKTAVKLILEGFGSRLDSNTVKAGGQLRFSLSDRPKQTGKAVYQLLALSGKDTLENEPIPFIVKQAEPGKILLLSAAPDFEVKFLKDWLFGQGYPVMLRNRISKDKFSTDFLNTATENLDRLSAGLLKKISVLIIDEAEFTALTATERESINRASAEGMGLLIRSAGLGAQELRESGSSLVLDQTMKDQELVPKLQRNTHTFSALPAGQTQFLKPVAGYTMLVTTNGKGLVNSRINGAGKILYSVIPSTYNWILDGKNADYTAFWSALLSTGMRKSSTSFSYELSATFPVQAEAIQLRLQNSAEDKVPVVRYQQQILSPLQDPILPFQWELSCWPENAGWNTISIDQQEDSFYVYRPEEWSVARNLERLNQNKLALDSKSSSISTAGSLETVKQELSLWWFIVGFLLSAGFLWYESKNQEQNRE